jgi:hypothetical protein
VIISNEAAAPRLASPPGIAQPFGVAGEAVKGKLVWQPERSPKGPVSIVVSLADARAVVLRNGVEIGSGPVAVDGPASGSWAYALRSIDAEGQHWMRVPLSAQAPADQRVPREEWQRFKAPEAFRRAIAAIVEPGTTVVVTTDSLAKGSTGRALTVIEASPEKK